MSLSVCLSVTCPGLLIAVTIGLLLGVVLGVILLAFVLSCHKRFIHFTVNNSVHVIVICHFCSCISTNYDHCLFFVQNFPAI